MKALILLTSLKKEEEDSNTKTIAEMVTEEFSKYDVDVEMINIRDLDYQPGVSVVVDNKPDDLTKVLHKILETDMLIFATPIWWGNHSSLLQAVIERMTFYDDWYVKNNMNVLYGKTFGCIVSGSDDGWQNIFGNLLNFACLLGFTMPPECAIGPSGQNEEELKNDEYTQSAIKIFCRNMSFWTTINVETKVGEKVQEKVRVKKTGYISGHLPGEENETE